MASRSSYSTCGSSTSSTYSYEFAPRSYVRPHTESTPVSGYPYIPHNATTQEREACNSRIHAIRARNASYAQPSHSGVFKPEGYRPHAGVEAGSIHIPAGKSSSLGHSADIHSSSEGEDSSGPETPYSHDRFIWKDSSDDVSEQESLDHSHHQGSNADFGSYKYYPPAPPVVPEEQHPTELASDTFTTAASAATRKELQQLTYEFHNLVLGFKFPPNLEFTNLSKEGELPKLTHTSTNKSLLEHNQRLEKLLEKLDAIESHGDKDIQRMRKQAVEWMLSELETLKRMESMALYNYATIHHYAGSDPYSPTVMDYYPAAAPPMQVVSLAPWGSYAEYVHGLFQQRACDSDWYLRQRAQVDITSAHNIIQEVLGELRTCVNAFCFPDRLDFQQLSEDGQVPQLADTKRNSAVNEHYQNLEELLERLQDVRTRGDGAVRRAKADAIAQVKGELEEMKRKKAVIWYNTQADGNPRKRFWAIW
ncbi:putative BAG domain protein [Rhizoctonia solani 123E]|uniref:Putative BAG domain protein n=1 Tax=Rhizoctonia solani 123E TaxID=1423351 RepID=A0A074S7Z0_9AGAM|nr:putative BAG domain protein [Rhizoctonia solani 123E]